ncbi:glycoside hydrolase family 95 protein [Dyadobacter psychrotolerans]|uniref:Glycoside hydrolase family 95 protein n=1 Tax=Dyadobacter psychrotolerans TaxID=2541721 RepID=A0A4R5E051_9BACT|nr:glycoside hydrolase family 95 protein [Dyadobacter psychrotolerans]TDE18354.1 glycoside hydrolase family 95 protein [Dyadobacter psychrotolerans]
MKRFILLLCIQLLIVLPAFCQNRNLKLWYKQPAREWEEALPVGNGKLAAMVFGGVATEHIQFNEETLWTGEPRSYAHKGAGKYLGQIRTLLSEGKQKEAETLATKEFMGDPVRQMAYQPFGDLYIDFPDHENFTEYKRELDLKEGISKVRYKSGNNEYSREVFASYPSQAIYVKINGGKAARLNFSLRMDALHVNKKVSGAKNELTLNVKVDKGVLEGVARVKIITDGQLSEVNGKITVKNATSATLVLAAATTYVDYKSVNGKPVEKVSRVLKTAPLYDEAKKLHIADYQKLFAKFSLDLPLKASSQLPTDERLRQFKSNPDDPAFLALYVQYARYLLIASSRPGTHPANLQGKWNDKLNPSWDSKYTVNINTEMNYWPVEMTNLSECHLPLFEMLKDLSKTGAEVAREHYNADGWLVHHNTDLWRGAAPINAANHGIWVTGGAWLSLHLWEHYRFTQDKVFLQKIAYPLMKGAAEFFTQFLVKDSKTGKLISSPSNSPENGGLVAGPTMDHQIIRGLFRACVESADILKTDPVFSSKLKALIPEIAPNKVGRAGQLQEWMTDVDDTTNHHRHVSHLWGVYPGEEIIPSRTPELLSAAKKSLEYRGDDGTGWSLAWKINYWARFLDGEHAYTMIRKLFNPVQGSSVKMQGGGSYPNLFDAHPPFQIDGNFGGAAGILELLVQSHLGELNLLPALPSALPEGKVSGLVARGAFELTMGWKGGKLLSVVILSKAGNKCNVRYGDKTVSFNTVKGKTYKFDGSLMGI